MCCKPIRIKNDKCEDKVENVFKTYRELQGGDRQDGKGVSQPYKSLILRKQRFFKMAAEQKHEQVSKLTSEKFPGLKNHFSWVSVFTLATMAILILLKSRLNDQKLKVFYQKKIFKNCFLSLQTLISPQYIFGPRNPLLASKLDSGRQIG